MSSPSPTSTLVRRKHAPATFTAPPAQVHAAQLAVVDSALRGVLARADVLGVLQALGIDRPSSEFDDAPAHLLTHQIPNYHPDASRTRPLSRVNTTSSTALLTPASTR